MNISLEQRLFDQIHKQFNSNTLAINEIGKVEVKQRINELTAPDERFIENTAFLKIMKVSNKTAHAWRSEGKIGYSKEGNKIYYTMSDIRDFLKKYHYKAFAQVEKLI